MKMAETETLTTTRFNFAGLMQKKLLGTTLPYTIHNTTHEDHHNMKNPMSPAEVFTIANGTGSKLLMNSPTLHTSTTFQFETDLNPAKATTKSNTFSAVDLINNMASLKVQLQPCATVEHSLKSQSSSIQESRNSVLQVFSSFFTPIRGIFSNLKRRIHPSTEDLFYDAEDDLPPQYEHLFDIDQMDSYVSSVQHCEFEKSATDFYDLTPEEIKLNYSIMQNDDYEQKLKPIVVESEQVFVDSTSCRNKTSLSSVNGNMQLERDNKLVLSGLNDNKTATTKLEGENICCTKELTVNEQENSLTEEGTSIAKTILPTTKATSRRNRRQRKRENKAILRGKHNLVEEAKKITKSSSSSFNPKSLNHKSKLTLHKNQMDKKRHAIEVDIQDDLLSLSAATSDCDTANMEEEDNVAEEFVITQMPAQSSSSLGVDDDDNTDIVINKAISFNADDFPAIESSPKSHPWPMTTICDTIKRRFRCKPLTPAAPSTHQQHASDCDSNSSSSEESDSDNDDDNDNTSGRFHLVNSPKSSSTAAVNMVNGAVVSKTITTTKNSVQSPSLQFGGPSCSDICSFMRPPFVPKKRPVRHLSECSDDSFICFESVGDDCVAANNTSNGQYSETDSDTDECDSTDGYISTDDDDEEDEEAEGGNEVQLDVASVSDNEDNDGVVTIGQLDSGFEERKPRVQFNLNPKVHVMHTWDFAYRQARKGTWERFALDRCRFANRVRALEPVLSPIFDAAHRKRVFKSRFADDNSNVQL